MRTHTDAACLPRDSAHICAGTRPAATSAPGLGPHLRRDSAHICAGTPQVREAGGGDEGPRVLRRAQRGGRPRRAARRRQAAVALGPASLRCARVPAQMWQGWAQSWRIAGVRSVPVQMWQGRVQSRCRCGRGGSSPGVLQGRAQSRPASLPCARVPVQMWQGWVQSRCRCGRGGSRPASLPCARVPAQMWLANLRVSAAACDACDACVQVWQLKRPQARRRTRTRRNAGSRSAHAPHGLPCRMGYSALNARRSIATAGCCKPLNRILGSQYPEPDYSVPLTGLIGTLNRTNRYP